MPLTILALDTSTEACSAALLYQNKIIDQFEIAARRHHALILPMLEKVMADAGINFTQLDAIAFGCGPGSFTGLRIAASITQAVAFAADKPVVPISTLRALAQSAYQELQATRVLASIDAQIKEVYWGAYQLNNMQIMELIGDETICPPIEIPFDSKENNWIGVGNGWDNYSEILQNKICTQLQKVVFNQHPSARIIAQLAAHDFQNGKAINAEQATPTYLRDKVI